MRVPLLLAGLVIVVAGGIFALSGDGEGPEPNTASSLAQTTTFAVAATPATSAQTTTPPEETVTTVEPFHSTVVLTDGVVTGTYDAMARCVTAGESVAIVNDASTENLVGVTFYFPAEPIRTTGVYEGPVELGMDARTPNFTTYAGAGTALITATVDDDGLFTSFTFEVEGELDGGTKVEIRGSC